MQSIEKIRASDGSGNASLATVQSVRSPSASTIIVDTVAGINGEFMGSMGTPHTFTDPVTSETITVISEATAVDFAGHVDGANLEIDTIAPGYTDLGSEIGDIIIIRPTTQYGDNIADVLAESHNDDGSLKDDSVTTDVILDNAVTTPKITDKDVTSEKLGSTVAFLARRETDQSGVPTATATIVQHNVEIFDTGDDYDPTTFTFTAPYNGVYHFDTGVNMDAPGSLCLGLIAVNNVTVARTDITETTPANDRSSPASITIELSIGDAVTAQVFHNAGSNRTVLGSNTGSCYFSGFLVGRT